MIDITRASKLRSLKAYGLRVSGLKYREIAPALGRRDRGLWSNIDFRDKPVTNEVVRSHVMKGARIVIRYFTVRKRKPPQYALWLLWPKQFPKVTR